MAYLQNNVIPKYINNNYNHDDSIIGLNFAVRGYVNLMFNRGIYEGQSLDSVIAIAEKNNKRFAIFIEASRVRYNKYLFQKAIIVDNELFVKKILTIDGKKLLEESKPITFVVASISNNNWSKGLSKFTKAFGEILLFKNNSFNRKYLKNAISLKSGDSVIRISNVKIIDDEWIHVKCNPIKNMDRFQYPNKLEVIK